MLAGLALGTEFWAWDPLLLAASALLFVLWWVLRPPALPAVKKEC